VRITKYKTYQVFFFFLLFLYYVIWWWIKEKGKEKVNAINHRIDWEVYWENENKNQLKIPTNLVVVVEKIKSKRRKKKRFQALIVTIFRQICK
jgi:hypothetical protein